jgi:hypothetical protein
MRVPGTRPPSSVGLCREMGSIVLNDEGADQLATIELVGGTVKLKYR